MDFILIFLVLFLVYVVVFRLRKVGSGVFLAFLFSFSFFPFPLSQEASVTNVAVFVVVLALLARKGVYLFQSGPGGGALSPNTVVQRNLTKEELWQYRGEGDSPIYLAVHGKIYDVTSGKDHYGPGGSYHGFAGRDASRAFVDLCFTPECLAVADQIDDWDTTDENRAAVKHWEDFYANEKRPDGTPKYPFVGYVVKDEANK